MALERRERPLVLVSPFGTGEYLETLGRLRVMFYNYPLELLQLSLDDFVSIFAPLKDFFEGFNYRCGS